ncbi:Uncharacterised protein [Mycobacteroides abscessus subsp. abscessus]|nr:Uncharacterised protein [Mycobacteroides abscessus subsp. abscessus]
MCLANAPSRARSGCVVGTPSTSSGAAVTGPTHNGATRARNAASSSSKRPVALARPNIEATAGALVKLIPSSSALIAMEIKRSIGRWSSGGSQRYTGTRITCAPAMVSASHRSAMGSHSVAAPCSCTAIRRPSTPSSSRRSNTSADDSDAGDHSSRNPA